MDLFAGLFGLGMLLVSLFVAYQFGVKPDRQARAMRDSRGGNSRRAQAQFRRLPSEKTDGKKAA